MGQIRAELGKVVDDIEAGVPKRKARFATMAELGEWLNEKYPADR